MKNYLLFKLLFIKMEIIIKLLNAINNWYFLSSVCWSNIYCSQEFVNGLYYDVNEIVNNNNISYY